MDGWMRAESIICMFVATCVHRTHLLLLFSISISSRLSLGRFFAMHEIRAFALPYMLVSFCLLINKEEKKTRYFESQLAHAFV